MEARRKQDLSQATCSEIHHFLPQDYFYWRVVTCGAVSYYDFSLQELHESCAFVLSLAKLGVAYPGPSLDDPKYFHLTAVVQAAWHLLPEDYVQNMIELSIYDKVHLRRRVLQIFVYRERWSDVAQATAFLGRALKRNELRSVAIAAGASGNLDFLTSLRDMDATLLNFAYEGVKEHGTVIAAEVADKKDEYRPKSEFRFDRLKDCKRETELLKIIDQLALPPSEYKREYPVRAAVTTSTGQYFLWLVCIVTLVLCILTMTKPPVQCL